MSTKNNCDILPYTPTDADYERVGDNLTRFSLGKNAPNWDELTFAFQACVDGKPVGDLIGDYNPHWGLGHVALLHVSEEVRGQGIGAKLMKLAEEFVKANGCEVMTVETPTWQAEGFYEQIGYREIGRTALPKVSIDGDMKYHIKYDKVLG